MHAAVRTAPALSRVVREAVEDAAADGVTYLELRSTPRALAADGADAAVRALAAPAAADAADAQLHRYVAVIGGALLDAAAAHPRIATRLLLSFDRAAPAAAHAAVARVATAWAGERLLGLAPSPAARTRLVVGVDVSGDPRRGDARALLPLLDGARRAGLRVAFHTGEVANADEHAAVAAWAPDRVGHMALLSADAVAAHVALGARAPPIEACPTSNALTLGLAGLDAHPTLRRWLDAGVPLAVCTDDPAAFRISLSSELERVARELGLAPEALAALAQRGFDYAFAPAEEVALVR